MRNSPAFPLHASPYLDVC